VRVNILLLRLPPLFRAPCARFASDKKSAVARQVREDKSFQRAGGGRDCGVQTQPGRGIGDSACRAARSCGRV